MPSITLTIPREIYDKMRRHPEVNWGEVVLRAIIDYLRRLEGETTTDELLERLGEEHARELDEIDPGKAEEHYKRMREAEEKRLSSTLASS